MTQLIKQNRNRVSWVYRHYPLASIHPQALKAAQAADCALRQGGNNAFWRYSDALFKEESLDETDFTRIARTQKLKVPAFTRCIENPDLATAMEALAHNAHEMGISGTPTTIVVNRRTGDQTRVPGAVPIETLQKAIDDILNAK
jgi:protein-disulfide isomerase